MDSDTLFIILKRNNDIALAYDAEQARATKLGLGLQWPWEPNRVWLKEARKRLYQTRDRDLSRYKKFYSFFFHT